MGYTLLDDTEPTHFFIALCTSANTPDADTNVLGDLTEIAIGHGYDSAGGTQLNRNSTDFDVHTENDSADTAEVQIKDVSWTASGGSIPASGSGARWAVLTDDNSTVANRQVLAYFDLSSDRTVSSGQTLTFQDMTLRLTE